MKLYLKLSPSIQSEILFTEIELFFNNKINHMEDVLVIENNEKLSLIMAESYLSAPEIKENYFRIKAKLLFILF